jgi:phosphopantothenoylcysteine decarboxylase/phosphopantothenate--cysteine ligase
MKLLITAGPTREYIDPVRFISNGSSGRTGFNLAESAKKHGHKVILVSGPVTLDPPKGVKYFPVISAYDMYKECLKHFKEVDAVIMTSAVGDFSPVRKNRFKVKKTGDKYLLELTATPDILFELGKRKDECQILMGFALEDRAGRDHALQKFSKKNLDAIVLNTPAAIGQKNNKVQVYTREKEWEVWPVMSKASLADKLIVLVEKLHAIQSCMNSNL